MRIYIHFGLTVVKFGQLLLELNADEPPLLLCLVGSIGRGVLDELARLTVLRHFVSLRPQNVHVTGVVP